MDVIMGLWAWIIEHWEGLATATGALYAAAVHIAALTPGDQDDNALKRVKKAGRIVSSAMKGLKSGPPMILALAVAGPLALSGCAALEGATDLALQGETASEEDEGPSAASVLADEIERYRELGVDLYSAPERYQSALTTACRTFEVFGPAILPDPDGDARAKAAEFCDFLAVAVADEGGE